MNFFKTLVPIVVVLGFSLSYGAEGDAVQGEYLVKLHSLQKNFSVNKLEQILHAQIKSKLSDAHIVVIDLHENKSITLEEIKNNPIVEYVEPNYIISASRKPNDLDLSKQWGLINFGQSDCTGQVGTAGIDINAEKAWNLQTGSKNIVVAVIDSGIDYTHPDLAENMWINEAEANGQAGIDDDGNGYIDDIYGFNFVNNTSDPKDDHSHGTHCAGIIGGVGNNVNGIVGVAWNVRLMSLKFLNNKVSGSTDNAIRAIDYAIKMKANIMSNSWGNHTYSQALMEAIERANTAGILFVVAAGNYASDNDVTPTYPANYNLPNILSVAAVNSKGDLVYFSNYGSTTVHVAAPGSKILSTVLDGKYNYDSGTSMAAPFASGVAALLLSSEPYLLPSQIVERITKTAKPLSSLQDKVISGGIIDAYSVLMNNGYNSFKPTQH